MQLQKYIQPYEDLSDYLIIDLREKPVKSVIPGSVSFPIFSSAEFNLLRSAGFTSKKSEVVLKNGKIEIDKIKSEIQGVKSILVCSDGGLLSKYTWELLRDSNTVFILKGGYRNYRKWVRRSFEKNYKLIVVCGKTGSGKTEMLESLDKSEKQVVNLEKLANHAGSVFGNLKGLKQPTQEQFENELASTLSTLDTNHYIYLESEQVNLGEVSIPLAFWHQMKTAIKIELIVPKITRIDRLVSSYANVNDKELLKGIEMLKQKLGIDKANELEDFVQQKKYREVASSLLDYFDETPGYQTIENVQHELDCADKSANQIIRELLKLEK